MPLRSSCLCYDPVFEQLANHVSVTINVCTSDMIWIGFQCLILNTFHLHKFLFFQYYTDHSARVALYASLFFLQSSILQLFYAYSYDFILIHINNSVNSISISLQRQLAVLAKENTTQNIIIFYPETLQYCNLCTGKPDKSAAKKCLPINM